MEEVSRSLELCPRANGSREEIGIEIVMTVMVLLQDQMAFHPCHRLSLQYHLA